ncbi:MAG: ATP-dependent DNA helicase [Lachnospiraceae bacterium]|nr:ATP-dependent DNA helicase [Lachnospiraceae bacterium]
MQYLNNGQIRISVRNLVEFIFQSGNIDNRRSRASDKEAMLAGGRIHRKIQKNMGSDYRAEVPLKITLPMTCKGINYDILLEGRADGVVRRGNELLIDEIKGMYQDVMKLTDSFYVHEAQAMCYAYMYSTTVLTLSEEQRASKEKNIVIQLTYCNLDTEEIRRFRKEYTFAEMEEWFLNLIAKYKKWSDFLVLHQKVRNESIRPLQFPFPYREGQRDMVVSVYRAINRKKTLYVQAPTGIGKTMSTVFPAVKAIGEGQAEKIFYLTAKTITRTVVEEAFDTLQREGAHLKSVTVTAKEKMCICEEMKCNPLDCPRAKGHFDRINQAVYEIVNEKDHITRDDIFAYSEKHHVCPFEFCLDITYWVDGIICDYNYVFDPNVKLKRYFAQGAEGNYIFLVDEAHNMVDRVREMYSAELHKEEFLAVKKLAKDDAYLANLLEKCNKVLLEYKRQCDTWMIRSEINALLGPLEQLENRCSKIFEEPGERLYQEELRDLFFKVRNFRTVSDNLEDSYVIYAEHREDGFYLKLFCVNPSRLLSECIGSGISTIFFSATLLPITYYKELLGGKQDDYAIYLPSPFPQENRKLLAVTDVSTKYLSRGQEQYRRMAEAIARVTSVKNGNYMVFLPSYKMLDAVLAEFVQLATDARILKQSTNMTEQEKEDFLQAFALDATEETTSLIAFCVLGGIFSEGIDLTADRLIGVCVIGTGIPQICTEREILKFYFDGENKNGFDYAYRFPGMNKVLQAAGRVIRTKEDAGVICLMDGRFREAANRNLFPMEWDDISYVDKHSLQDAVEKFWQIKI